MLSPHLLFLGLLALIIFFTAPVAAAARSVTDLFEINFANNQNGGCQSIGQTRLQRLVDESEALASKAVQMVTDADAGELFARKALQGFLKGGDRNNPLNPIIKDRYSKVLDFLQNANYPPGGKPYLFCDSTWLEWQTWTTPARDTQGDEYNDISNTREVIFAHPAVSAFRLAYPVLATVWFPYWSDTHKAYAMAPYYDPVNGRPPGFCNRPKTYGQTETWEKINQPRSLRRTLTLCPQSFTGEDLGSTILNPVTVAQLRTLHAVGNHGNLATISEVMTNEVHTLFHELFHLVLGAAASVPSTTKEVYPSDDLSRLAGAEAVRNAESYTISAVAWWYTRRELDQRIVPPTEFFTTYQTRG